MTDSAPRWVSLSASAVRTLPFGRYQLANALAKFAHGPFVARLPQDLGGASFVCDLQDTISREVCFTGRYEPQETQLALALLESGMTVVDVGANWGYFSLIAARRRGGCGFREPRVRRIRRARWQLRCVACRAPYGTW